MKTSVIATLAFALSAAAAPLASTGNRHLLPRGPRRALHRRGQCDEQPEANKSAATGHNFAAEAPADVPAAPQKENKKEDKEDKWTESATSEAPKETKNSGNGGGQSGSTGKYSWGGPDFLKLPSSNGQGSHVGFGPRENAKGTFYSLENPAENHGFSKTACGIDNPPDTTPLVAISMDNWRELWGGSTYDAPFCGHHVKVRWEATGREAIATVVDGCATCDYNHIDMSPALFYYLTDSKEAGDKLGMMTADKGFSWEWVNDSADVPGVSNFVELPSDGFHWDGAGGAGTSPY